MYVAKMILNTVLSDEDYSVFELLTEDEISNLDLTEFTESDKNTKKLLLKIFADCPYINLHQSLEKIHHDNTVLERLISFSMDDSLTVRQQLNLLNRYNFSNLKYIKDKLIQR